MKKKTKKKTNIKKANGRPKIEIDWKRVNDMAKCHADGETIAAVIGVSYDTLERRCKEDFNISFAEYSLQKKMQGKNMLKTKMMNVAMSGNVTMLIWLSKNHLGYKDQPTDQSNKSVDLNYNFKNVEKYDRKE